MVGQNAALLQLKAADFPKIEVVRLKLESGKRLRQFCAVVKEFRAVRSKFGEIPTRRFSGFEPYLPFIYSTALAYTLRTLPLHPLCTPETTWQTRIVDDRSLAVGMLHKERTARMICRHNIGFFLDCQRINFHNLIAMALACRKKLIHSKPFFLAPFLDLAATFSSLSPTLKPKFKLAKFPSLKPPREQVKTPCFKGRP